MKKSVSLLIILLIIFAVCGCSTERADTRSLSDFKNVFEQAGYTLERESEPLYQMVGAIAGTMFYVDGSVFKIYQYKDSAAYNKATNDYPLIKDMPKNGLFIAESNSDELKEFFNSITPDNKFTLPQIRQNIQNIELNRMIESKDWELTPNNVMFTQRLDPEQVKSFYNYYQVKDTDNTYLVLTMSVKNISALELDASEITKIKAKYDNKYEYSSFSVLESDGTFETFGKIKPLTVGKVQYLFEMPKTIESDDKSLELEFKLNDILYAYKVR